MKREEKNAIFIEGLAAFGRISEYWREKCNAPGRERIVVRDIDGHIYYTPCIDHRALKKVILAIEDYKRLSRLLILES